jgi:hypothetical protein
MYRLLKKALNRGPLPKFDAVGSLRRRSSGGGGGGGGHFLDAGGPRPDIDCFFRYVRIRKRALQSRNFVTDLSLACKVVRHAPPTPVNIPILTQ